MTNPFTIELKMNRPKTKVAELRLLYKGELLCSVADMNASILEAGNHGLLIGEYLRPVRVLAEKRGRAVPERDLVTAYGVPTPAGLARQIRQIAEVLDQDEGAEGYNADEGAAEDEDEPFEEVDEEPPVNFNVQNRAGILREYFLPPPHNGG